MLPDDSGALAGSIHPCSSKGPPTKSQFTEQRPVDPKVARQNPGIPRDNAGPFSAGRYEFNEPVGMKV